MITLLQSAHNDDPSRLQLATFGFRPPTCSLRSTAHAPDPQEGGKTGTRGPCGAFEAPVFATSHNFTTSFTAGQGNDSSNPNNKCTTVQPSSRPGPGPEVASRWRES